MSITGILSTTISTPGLMRCTKAWQSLQAHGIRAIITDLTFVEDAVNAYLNGTLVDHPERLH